MTTDEHPKPQTLLAQIAKLPPVFKKGGVVTAASASGICDGAAAVIIASEEAVAKHGLTPLARVVGYGIAGELYIFILFSNLDEFYLGNFLMEVAANEILQFCFIKHLFLRRITSDKL